MICTFFEPLFYSISMGRYMDEKERRADSIEHCIREMCSAFTTTETKMTEYLVCHYPKRYDTWFVAIFFSDIRGLKESLNNGVCYAIHSFLHTEFSKREELNDCLYSIRFLPGTRPTETNDIKALFETFVAQHKEDMQQSNKEYSQLCSHCGHDFDSHELWCHLPDEASNPKEGWMTCPEDDCCCFTTWSADYTSSAIS